MKVRLIMGLLAMAGLGLLAGPALRSPAVTLAAEGALLAETHKTGGIGCAECHQEEPPQKMAPTQKCLGCHGDYDELAKLTVKVEPNPHQSHEGKLECEACHHVHKPSKDHCLECHSWGFKVP